MQIAAGRIRKIAAAALVAALALAVLVGCGGNVNGTHKFDGGSVEVQDANMDVVLDCDPSMGDVWRYEMEGLGMTLMSSEFKQNGEATVDNPQPGGTETFHLVGMPDGEGVIYFDLYHLGDAQDAVPTKTVTVKYATDAEGKITAVMATAGEGQVRNTETETADEGEVRDAVDVSPSIAEASASAGTSTGPDAEAASGASASASAESASTNSASASAASPSA